MGLLFFGNAWEIMKANRNGGGTIDLFSVAALRVIHLLSEGDRPGHPPVRYLPRHCPLCVTPNGHHGTLYRFSGPLPLATQAAGRTLMFHIGRH